MAQPSTTIIDDLPDSALITRQQFGAHLGVSHETVRQILLRGDVARVVISPRCIRIRVGDLRAYLARSTERGTSEAVTT